VNLVAGLQISPMSDDEEGWSSDEEKGSKGKPSNKPAPSKGLNFAPPPMSGAIPTLNAPIPTFGTIPTLSSPPSFGAPPTFSSLGSQQSPPPKSLGAPTIKTVASVEDDDDDDDDDRPSSQKPVQTAQQSQVTSQQPQATPQPQPQTQPIQQPPSGPTQQVYLGIEVVLSPKENNPGNKINLPCMEVLIFDSSKVTWSVIIYDQQRRTLVVELIDGKAQSAKAAKKGNHCWISK